MKYLLIISAFLPSISLAQDIYNDPAPINITYVTQDGSVPHKNFIVYDQYKTEPLVLKSIQDKFGTDCKKKDSFSVKEIVCPKGIDATSFTLECHKTAQSKIQLPWSKEASYVISDCHMSYVSSASSTSQKEHDVSHSQDRQSSSSSRRRKSTSNRFVYINTTLIEEKVGDDPVPVLDPESVRGNTILTEFDDLYILSKTLTNKKTNKPVCSMDIIRGLNKISCPDLSPGKLKSIPFRCTVNPALKTKPTMFGIDHCVLLVDLKDAFQSSKIQDITAPTQK